MNKVRRDNQNFFWSNTLVVIVLYNIDLYDSLTFTSLRNAAINFDNSLKINLLIYDNSLHRKNYFKIIKEDSRFNVECVHNPENPGVSKAYNQAAKLAEKMDMNWLIILDQDTKLPDQFIYQYEHAANKFPDFPLYAPKVYDGSILFSPCRYHLNKGSNLKNIRPGVHPMKNKNVLNSGLLIRLESFLKVGGYDETVSFYFSDFVFFNRLKKQFQKFVVVDCRLEHQLSSVNYDDTQEALNRFVKYCVGAYAASKSEKSLLNYWLYVLTIGGRGLLMSIRLNDVSFFRTFFKIFFNV